MKKKSIYLTTHLRFSPFSGLSYFIFSSLAARVLRTEKLIRKASYHFLWNLGAKDWRRERHKQRHPPPPPHGVAAGFVLPHRTGLCIHIHSVTIAFLVGLEILVTINEEGHTPPLTWRSYSTEYWVWHPWSRCRGCPDGAVATIHALVPSQQSMTIGNLGDEFKGATIEARRLES